MIAICGIDCNVCTMAANCKGCFKVYKEQLLMELIPLGLLICRR